jgi:hypothetical protein
MRRMDEVDEKDGCMEQGDEENGGSERRGRKKLISTM